MPSPPRTDSAAKSSWTSCSRVSADADRRGAEQNEDGRIRIAVIGRPNVGKSTLINRLIGDERLITSEVAGTTRDSILVPFERDGREFTLIDTAGVRRRAKIDDEVEHLSVSKTLQAIAEAHVVTMVVDAQDSIGEQDASVLGLALSRGRALMLAVNKWDNIPIGAARRNPPPAHAQDRFRAVRAACTSSARGMAPASAT